MNLRLYCQPIFNSAWVPLLMTACLLALLWVRPAYNSVTTRRRTILNVLRATVIVCAFLAMMRPTVVRTETKPLDATLAILVDDSRSMQTADVDDKTRYEVARQVVRDLQPELRKLGKGFEVKLYHFSDQLAEVALDDAPAALPETAAGSETDIGGAIDALLRQEAGKRLGGVLLITDGAQRALAPRVDVGQVVRQLASSACPLFTITLGKSRHQSETRDVAVENFEDQYSVFTKNQLTVHATIRIQGYPGKRIPVELEITCPDETSQRVGPQIVSASDDSPTVDVHFNYTPQKPGQYLLKLVAAAQPGESVVENNSLSAFLDVRDGGLRVLYLCGNVAWQEHNFIRRSIDESPDIQLDFRWIASRTRKKWPVNLKPLLEENAYDVFVLADVDAAAFGAQLDLLAQQVDEGKGLLMTGGPHSFGPGGFAETSLKDILPIEMSRLERQSFDRPIRQDVHLNGDLKAEPNAIHFITRLGSGDPVEIWRSLPPFRGANRFLKLKPTASVLLETTRNDPLLVQGEYGAGRVLAFAADSTYRWYRYGFQAEHKRFWRQVILWLAKKEEPQENEVWIRLDQRRFAAGARVPFSVGVQDGQGTPIEDVKFEARVATGEQNKNSAAVPVTRFQQQWTGATEPLITPGSYTLTVRAMRDAEELGTAEAQFIVLSQDIEMADPTANASRMDLLARTTAEFGGKSLPPERAADVIEELKKRPLEFVSQRESRWQLTDTPVDAWLLFVAMIGLLSTEWFLRKKWQMA